MLRFPCIQIISKIRLSRPLLKGVCRMSLAENAVDFNEIERSVQKMCNELGCEVLKTALEKWDAELAANRDRAEYRHKGKRKTVIKTVLGEVEYERAVYETRSADGVKSCVYLLDEAMGISGSGFMSGLLSEQIVQASCESSYRSAARSVSEMTGQVISHTAAWNVVQCIGERLDAQEHQAAKLAADNKGGGTLETKVLFEELDGIWLYLQGKSRKVHGKSREMKLCIAYDGWKRTGKKRYETTNKAACANFEISGKFAKRKEGAIAEVYNVDEIEMRLLNGDGAVWIKDGITEDVHYQLDQFHRNRAVLQYVYFDPDAQKIIMELLYTKQTDLLLEVIEAYANSTENETERENFLKLHEYFTNNKDYLVPCHRRGLALPQPPEGKIYRRMGTMESNVFSIIGNRMKGRRACWSIEGGNNLARLLCLKFTNKLSETLKHLTSGILPERYAEELPIILSAKVPKREGKGYNGFHKAAPFPATPDFKWLRDITAFRPLFEN